MSQSTAGGLGSPQTNSEIESRSAAGAPEAADQESKSASLSTPTVDERVAEFVAEYRHLSGVPLSETHGQELRAELTRDRGGEIESWRTDDGARQTAMEPNRREAVDWASAVRELLEWDEKYQDMTLAMELGRPQDPEHAEFETPAEHSYHPDYAKEEYAQLQAFARELTGGERPTGGVAEGAYEEPYLMLSALTASTTTADGDPIPAVDHDRAIVDAWSDDSGVRNKLRYVLEDDLGLEPEDWEYHRQGEPHPGGGVATPYRHDHPMVVFDAAELDREPTREDFRPVIAKHIEKCELAEWAAHDMDADDPEDRPVVVESVGSDGVADVAGYMAKYVSFGEEALREREIEYVAYAAIQWGTNSQKYTRSDGANHAIRADRCKQAVEDPERDQERFHGEKLIRSTRRGYRWECADCGSPWGIDQHGETLTEHRLAESDDGLDVEGDEESLRDRWPSARAAGRVNADGSVEGFEDPPEWRLRAVIDGEGEEHPPVPGGPEMLPLKLKEDRPPPVVPTQNWRRTRVLEEAATGATREEIVAAVDANQEAVEHDVEQLLRRGDLIDQDGDLAAM